MIQWSKEQIGLRNDMITWAATLNDNDSQQGKGEQFPIKKWEIVSNSNLLGMPIEEQHGGQGHDILTTMFVLEALGRSCEDAGLNFIISSHIVSTEIPILYFGSLQQKCRYLPDLCRGRSIGAHAITEPSGGSDAYRMKTSAEKVGNSYVLNGSKVFITNAPFADLFIVYAATDKNKGALGGISAFIVERGTPGLKLGPSIKKMGLITAPFCEVYFDNCEISEDQLLGKPGRGFSILNHVMKWEILCSFAINLGEMERQLVRCVNHLKSGQKKEGSKSSYAMETDMVVDMKIGLETSKLLLYNTARKFYNKENISLELAMAKLVTSETFVKSSLQGMQVYGAHSFFDKNGISREFCNSIAGKIYSGSSEIQRNTIAALIGL